VKSAPPAAATHIYQALLHLYPAPFRREFGDEMVCDFDDATDEAWVLGGWTSVLGCWTLITADFIWTAIVQWLRTGWPAVAALSATWTTLCCTVIAQQIRPDPREFSLIPPKNPDQEMLVMLLGIAVVFVIIAATIVITGRFWLQVLRRQRRARSA
jgi:hypothetical protein